MRKCPKLLLTGLLILCACVMPEAARNRAASDAKKFVGDYGSRVSLRELFTFRAEREEDGPICADFSPDGKRIVITTGDFNSRKEDQIATVLDAQTGRKLIVLNGHTDAIRGIVYSPDEKWIVTGSWDNTVKVWDSQTGKETLSFPVAVYGSYCVAVSPDSRFVAAGGQAGWEEEMRGWILVWDIKQNRKIHTIKGYKDTVKTLAFSPDGKRIASGSRDGTVKIWDVQTGKERLSFEAGEGMIGQLAFSPDGKRLVTAGVNRGNAAQIWNAETGDEILSLIGHTGWVQAAVYSRDGRYIITGSHDKTVKCWDAQTGKELLTLKGARYDVYLLALSSDDARLLTGSYDAAKMWRINLRKR